MTARKLGGKLKRIDTALIAAGCLAGVIVAYSITTARRADSTMVPTPRPSSVRADSTVAPAPSPSSVTEATANVGLPVRLSIAKLQVDAKIEYMGVTKAGAMDVPTDVLDAGWYKYGAHPGDEGSAVIGGHLNGVRGEPGIFLNLNKLQVGDSVSVLDDTGKTTVFVVRQIRTYGQDEQPNEVFHSQQGAHLNLITCTGAWNRSLKQYSKRLVVFADKAS